MRDTFFAGYRPASYTQHWDIPAAENQEHGAMLVNLKVARLGTAVDLGDTLRQYEIDEPFMLIIGFWQQDGDGKRMVNLIAPKISPELWRKLWSPVTYADLLKLDAVIKDTGPAIEETRRRVLQMKNAPPFTEAIIQVNPKTTIRVSAASGARSVSAMCSSTSRPGRTPQPRSTLPSSASNILARSPRSRAS